MQEYKHHHILPQISKFGRGSASSRHIKLEQSTFLEISMTEPDNKERHKCIQPQTSNHKSFKSKKLQTSNLLGRESIRSLYIYELDSISVPNVCCLYHKPLSGVAYSNVQVTATIFHPSLIFVRSIGALQSKNPRDSPHRVGSFGLSTKY